MKMRKLTIALFAAALLTPAAAPAQTSQKLTATKVNEYGLIYTLPATTVTVTLEARKTVKTPGEFYLYARKYLGVEPITAPSVEWELVAAEITPGAVADEDRRYVAQFKSGSSPFMMLSDRNFPLALNDEEYQPATAPAPILRAEAAKPTILELPVASQAVTEEMLQSRSSAKRAELAAAKIYELRQQRSDIIAGQADNMPSDGQAMKLALDNLADQEAALTAMFLGTTSVSTEVRSYSYTPSGDDAETVNTVIARLSAVDGLVDADNLAGDPVYLKIATVTRGKLPVNEKGVEKSFPKGGVAYCIPGQAKVTVSFDGRALTTADIDVAQYGVVFGLDPSLFTNKKETTYLRFNPLTGAILELGTL